jgi:hypothetical protein
MSPEVHLLFYADWQLFHVRRLFWESETEIASGEYLYRLTFSMLEIVDPSLLDLYATFWEFFHFKPFVKFRRILAAIFVYFISHTIPVYMLRLNQQKLSSHKL